VKSDGKIANEVLLKIYACSASHGSDTWSLESAFRSLGILSDHEVVNSTRELMLNRGWLVQNGSPHPKMLEGGERFSIAHETSVTLTPEGKLEAIRILKALEPKSISERLSSVPRSDWIALGALIISVVALAW
jgi:hypothetical protein